MFNGPVFNNEVVQANSRAVNNAGFSESLDEANSLYSRLTGASFELVPSSYKGGVVYSGVPNTGNGDINWTRGSDAWRTNAEGFVQRVPWNLVLQSETFDSASWTKFDTSVTANAAIAPNGTATADKLIETATTNVHWLFQSTTTTSSLAMSCYMKKGERDWGIIRTRTASGDRFAWFNLNTGVVGTVESGITASIINVGDGWYRCIVVSANPTTNANPFVIGLSNADNVSSYTGNGTSGIFIWGAQLVEGSSARAYFPTTDRLNVPRLSYMYGSAPALLLEPQRTNLITQSGDLTSFLITPSTGLTSALNSTISPDGSNTARKITNTTTTEQHRLYQGFTLSNATAYTYSVYLKNDTAGWAQISFFLGTTSTAFANINLTTGDLGTTGGGTTYTVTSVGNGWYRLRITATTDGTTCNVQVYPLESNSLNANPTTTGTVKSIFVWGAQLELGAYPSTYISTQATSVTRLADSFTRGNIYTNGLITAAGGTWFTELRGNLSLVRDAFSNGLQLADNNTTGGISGNGFIVRRNDLSQGRLNIQKVIAGVPTALFQTTTDTFKFAIKWNGTTADVFVNGVKVTSATSFTTTNMEFLNGQGSDVPKFIQSMALFSTPLSDDQCVALTSDFTEGESVIGSYERYVNSNGGAVENLNTITNLIQNLK